MTGNHQLDDIFAELKGQSTPMPEDLSQRILADALRVQQEIASEVAIQDQAASPPSGWLRSLRDRISARIEFSPLELGFGGVGFATALIAGVWLGVNPPVAINTLLEQEITTAEALTFIDPTFMDSTATDSFEFITGAM